MNNLRKIKVLIGFNFFFFLLMIVSWFQPYSIHGDIDEFGHINMSYNNPGWIMFINGGGWIGFVFLCLSVYYYCRSHVDVNLGLTKNLSFAIICGFVGNMGMTAFMIFITWTIVDYYFWIAGMGFYLLIIGTLGQIWMNLMILMVTSFAKNQNK